MMRRITKFILPGLFILVLAAGCTSANADSPVTPEVKAQATALPTARDTATHTPQPSPSPTVTPSPTKTTTNTPTPTPEPAVLIGAGDIALCGDPPEYKADDRTADMIEQLLAEHPQAGIFIAGDVVQAEGRAVEYQNCFGPTWGRFIDRIRPVPGNHDYMTESAGPYYAYFGETAGPAGLGYYSYDLGEWHIVAINSNCNDIACGPNSAQVAWLREDLLNNDKKCTLAYWHHPRFSSGLAGGSGVMNPIWRTAVELGVDVVVNGHDHNYERFAPMNAEGQADPQGTRMFVSGTGGALLRVLGTLQPNSEVRYEGTHGVMRFILHPDRYEWSFLPLDNDALTDQGSDLCR